MSFFSKETICLECSRKEEDIRAKIRQEVGVDADLVYQGCGFVPIMKGGGKRTLKNGKNSHPLGAKNRLSPMNGELSTKKT
jgi:hypothetical protein